MTDVGSYYAFGVSHAFLKGDGFAPEWYLLLKGASEQTTLTKQLPELMQFARLLLTSWLLKVNPQMTQAVPFAKVDIAHQNQSIVTNPEQAVKSSLDNALSDDKNKIDKGNVYPTIFHELLDSNLPAVERMHQRLLAEGVSVMMAGTTTIARYLRTITYHKDLARAEIVYSLALLMRRWTGEEGFGMRLYETDRKGVEIERDFFNPYSEFGSKDVRVVFK
ncbi:hypothetical protein E8E11_007735 [Didymella keratinophila]|nr:hypothetical protein E8E11_007735 [Didymella keratinophila]